MKNRKTIFIVTNYFPPEMGAASSRIYNLAKGLSDFDYEVEVICPLPNYPNGTIFKEYRGRFKKEETIKGIKTRRYWIYPTVSKNPVVRLVAMCSFAFSLWFAFFYFLRKKPQTVIIQQSPLLVSFSAMVLVKMLPACKRILNISDLWPMSAAELGVIKERGKTYRMLEKIEKFNYRQAHFIMGQSNEILTHVKQYVDKPLFLYRNISPEYLSHNIMGKPLNGKSLKIIYAGLLGVAQGIYSICENVDFKETGVEFHIYGSGNEEQKIRAYIKKNKHANVFFHGSVTKEELHKAFALYHASIVPLANRIYGAVPSKIYELAAFGIPVLFSGGGEGANIIDEHSLGYISTPGNFKELEANIKRLKALSDVEYSRLIDNCVKFKKGNLDFSRQMTDLNVKIKTL